MLDTATSVADYLGIEYDKQNPPNPIKGWVNHESVSGKRIWAEIAPSAVTFSTSENEQSPNISSVLIPCTGYQLEQKLALLANPINLD